MSLVSFAPSSFFAHETRARRFLPLTFTRKPPVGTRRPRVVRAKIVPVWDEEDAGVRPPEDLAACKLDDPTACASPSATPCDEDDAELVALIPSSASRRRRAPTPCFIARFYTNPW